MNKFVSILAPLFFLSCSTPQQEVDLIIHHAVIYTVDSSFSVKEAMVIKDGKIIETNSNEIILRKYTGKQITDAKGKSIFPGFIDAHCHFYSYGKGLTELNLVGTNSFQEILEKAKLFYELHFEPGELTKNVEHAQDSSHWLIGRGWDQNDWEDKEFPTKEKLDRLFPNTPVLLTRIDGHAAIVNQYVLDLAEFDANTKITGGELIIKNGRLTGVLIDNAVNLVEKLIPKSNRGQIQEALLNAQTNCIAMGLTTVDDAGLEKNSVDEIDQLQKENKLKMRVYAMLSPTPENLNYYLKNGIYKTDKLNVRSFKFYGDGALGSRGACLCKDYDDKAGWKGFLLSDIAYFENFAKRMSEKGFQMNTHCIGDSAVKVILSVYKKYVDNKKDVRWRIEHAQVVDANSFASFTKNCLPSVQPTHATSDMYWAQKRLGKERIQNAYAYKKLLFHATLLPLGTDFPVENISPFKTFYAAVFRKDAKGFPEKGFQMENALTREETLKGMTLWAAYSNFEDKEKGSLEAGKYADFVLLDKDLMTCEEKEVLNNKVIATYINGELVYSVNKKQ